MNFDGAHVDLAVCQRTVEYLAPERLIAITDHTEVPGMAGEALHRLDGSTLWMREDDVVAAGSLGIEAQIANMREIGMSDVSIALVVSVNPRQALAAGGLQAVGS